MQIAGPYAIFLIHRGKIFMGKEYTPGESFRDLEKRGIRKLPFIQWLL